jgi:hypothetical protein
MQPLVGIGCWSGRLNATGGWRRCLHNNPKAVRVLVQNPTRQRLIARTKAKAPHCPMGIKVCLTAV